MGHGAPGCSQRGLEMLVLPEATSYSWVATNPPPAPTLHSVHRPPALACLRAKLVPNSALPWHIGTLLGPGHVPADCMDAHSSEPAWQHGGVCHCPLVFPQQPLALQLDTSARFVSGQPGRDSDLSSGDVAQPSAGSQLQTYLPRLAGQWGEEGTQQNLLSGGFLFLWGTVVLPLSAAKKRGFGTPGNTLFL